MFSIRTTMSLLWTPSAGNTLGRIGSQWPSNDCYDFILESIRLLGLLIIHVTVGCNMLPLLHSVTVGCMLLLLCTMSSLVVLCYLYYALFYHCLYVTSTMLPMILVYCGVLLRAV
jgi:hypothetical protein